MCCLSKKQQLYQKFNCARPLDYHGHSLSVSDVIMLNQDGKISAHCVDSIGFKELPGFLDKKAGTYLGFANAQREVRCPGVQSYRVSESEGWT